MRTLKDVRAKGAYSEKSLDSGRHNLLRTSSLLETCYGSNSLMSTNLSANNNLLLSHLPLMNRQF
jgi:hypothetical protein